MEHAGRESEQARTSITLHLDKKNMHVPKWLFVVSDMQSFKESEMHRNNRLARSATKQRAQMKLQNACGPAIVTLNATVWSSQVQFQLRNRYIVHCNYGIVILHLLHHFESEKGREFH
jgi:hypothetical protein